VEVVKEINDSIAKDGKSLISFTTSTQNEQSNCGALETI
jgi:hypothetical protein